MTDTLLLGPALHFSALVDTSLLPIQTSPKDISLHLTTFSFGLTPFKFPTASFHLTSLHFTSLHFNFRRFSSHFISFHFTPFIIAFLTLYLKILGLQGKVPNASTGSRFQLLMVLFTKEFNLQRNLILKTVGRPP